MPRYAAVDIGSNSIRTMAAEVVPGSGAEILASEREVTRLGESVFRGGLISQEAMELVCGVLAGMAGTYRKLDVAGVRAVATSAVRLTAVFLKPEPLELHQPGEYIEEKIAGAVRRAGRGPWGRELSQLDREQRHTVEAMARRCGASLAHARKVAGMAHRLFESLQPLHRLPAGCGRLLEAAAYLHDTGHFVSDTGHHKHAAYLVANSDLPGFTDQERKLVAISATATLSSTCARKPTRAWNSGPVSAPPKSSNRFMNARWPWSEPGVRRSRRRQDPCHELKTCDLTPPSRSPHGSAGWFSRCTAAPSRSTPTPYTTSA